MRRIGYLFMLAGLAALIAVPLLFLPSVEVYTVNGKIRSIKPGEGTTLQVDRLTGPLIGVTFLVVGAGLLAGTHLRKGPQEVDK